MKINRLRLLGFKSFVEPTDLLIEPGLTGVLGPNGCGKSNLLEALRWVMGETSYRSMRASAMDDVIFSGTSSRPARNTAEVTVFLDNSARTAPAEYNNDDTIEISRRIEREAGSAYRINGREARARDVKILFEDSATGARSPALVRQGQIGEIINAKPEQRRRVLEDAAGIAGLHSRRHEAELRLRAAENNLARLGDVMGQLNSQVESLKRQARSARRYKEISTEIRKAEALFAHLTWTASQGEVERQETALADATRKLGLATQDETRALSEEAKAAEAIAPLRQQEAERAAALQRLTMERDAFEREAERMVERECELNERVAQFGQDIEREGALLTETKDAISQLDDEDAQLVRDSAAYDSKLEQLTASAADTQRELEAAESQLAELSAEIAEANARQRELTSAETERTGTLARLSQELDNLSARLAEAEANAPSPTVAAEASADVARLTDDLSELRESLAEIEAQVRDRSEEAAEQRRQSDEARLAAGRLQAEVATLVNLLKPAENDAWPPVVDALSVAPGYESALGAALGDDLDAAVHSDAPVRWQRLTAQDVHTDAPLPEGAEPLITHVSGPDELTRRLLQIGLVARDLGPALQPLLEPGQRLVSLEGDMWRWDGYSAAGDAPTPAARRLVERNRLEQLEKQAMDAVALSEAADAGTASAESALQTARTDEAEQRQHLTALQDTLAAARDFRADCERRQNESLALIKSLEDAQERTTQARDAADTSLIQTRQALEKLAPANERDDTLAELRQTVSELRTMAASTQAEIAGLEQADRLRRERRAVVDNERARLSQRYSAAQTQLAALQTRRQDAESELQALDHAPQDLENRRNQLMSAVAQAEQHRNGAADALAQADSLQRAAVEAVRTAQAAVSSEREERARIEARLEGAREKRSADARNIRETLGCTPDGCLAIAEMDEECDLPDLPDAEHRLQRLRGDRERLGGVNLQAEDELQDISAQYDSMQSERADLEEGIAKLRQGISQLNREGRQRLKDAFDTVNGHFKRLFSTLFGGGEAELMMIESDDPLEGGLEIMAKPPGKKPAVLSLLSGGEQALTALSLIFAVFLTNPSPICVLDEVDAPLDDSNVDRFCNMMETMAADTDTRFLVITHHPMTMERMHRLFGVTMAEKGVSQLVSVDLGTAERMLDTA